MVLQVVHFEANIPSDDDFGADYRQYGPFARGEGRYLFDIVMTAKSLHNMRAMTRLDLPAVSAVAPECRQAWLERNVANSDERDRIRKWNHAKQFIGALVCCLMEANGFEKTGIKRGVHYFGFIKNGVNYPGFTKGEFYREVRPLDVEAKKDEGPDVEVGQKDPPTSND